MFKNTNSVNLCQNSVFVRVSKMRFSKRKLYFFVFVMLLQEKQKKNKMEKAKQPYKNSVFLRWSSKNEKSGKIDFLLPKSSDTICVRKGEKRAFSCTLSVLAKNVWPKTVKTSKKQKKNSGFSGNCPKPKMTPFFEKGLVWHGWKSGFY